MKRIALEKGKEIKEKQGFLNDEIKKLNDNETYSVTRLITPFGSYVVGVEKIVKMEMSREEYLERFEEILSYYPQFSAMDKERTALSALRDADVLERLGWTLEEIEEMEEEIRQNLSFSEEK